MCHNTITDRGLLREELARIRDAGSASSFEETNLGVWGLAVPILDANGSIVCAIGGTLRANISRPLVIHPRDQVAHCHQGPGVKPHSNRCS